MKSLVMTMFRILLFLVTAAFVTSFITSNTATITVGFFPLPYVLEMPLYALGLSMLCIGLLLGGMTVSTTHIAKSLRRQKHTRNEKKQTKAMQHELTSLRIERDMLQAGSRTPAPTLLPPVMK